MDLAGTVEAVGRRIVAFREGDPVYGLAGGVGGLQGSLAEFAVVDADLLAPKPSRLTMREAAAIPLVFITAWEGLVDRVRIRASHKLLIHGAGGVGQMAIQIAHVFGANVFAADRSAKRGLIESLGATAIDSELTSVDSYVNDYTGGAGFDVIFGTIGGAALDASFKAVRRFGHVVSSLGWGTHSLEPLSARAGTYSGIFTLLPLLTGEGRAHHGEILRDATRLAEAGRLTPLLDPRRYTLDTAAQAYLALEQRTATGKVVMDIAD